MGALSNRSCPRGARAKSMDNKSRRRSSDKAQAASIDYKLHGPMPARMYEVILPKKLGYFGKVQEVLEDLFNEDAIRAIPFVRRSIADRRRRDASFDEDGWVKT